MRKQSEGNLYFLLVATILPVICIALFIWIPITNDSIFYLPLFGLQSMAPTLAAMIAIAHSGSTKKLQTCLKQKYLSYVNPILCVFSFAIPFLILLVSKATSVLFLNNDWRIILPNANKMLIIGWALIAEELGWRGYLQERIESAIGMIFTPLVVGVIWGLWHFHYYLLGTMEGSFALLIVGCVFESYGYFVITKLAKGNLIPASLWHLSGNLFLTIFGLDMVDKQGGNDSYSIMTFAYSICIFGFLVYYYRETKKSKAGA